METCLFPLGLAAVLVALAPSMAGAAPAAEVAAVAAGGDAITWQPQIADYDRLMLTVSGPDGVVQREFAAGEAPSFSLFDDAGFHRADGSYTWELRVVPRGLRTRSESESGLASTPFGLRPGAPSQFAIQSGHFAIRDGALVGGGGSEPETSAAAGATAGGGAATGSQRAITAADQVIADDLIVDGSICVGLDCVNGESFGFDTLRLKENNLRIRFQDTSNSASFPSNDWIITANDSSNGGANYLSIDDAETGRHVFLVEAGAPANSLYVDDGGRIGRRTSTPVVELHIVDGDTPTVRLEQDGSSGFTPQTWDLAGNETNFFVRDVTNGSKLPFRIRPQAPGNSIYVDTDGDIGLGTQSPEADLEVETSGDTDFRVTRGTGGTPETQFRATVTANNAFFGTSTNDVMAFTTNALERMRITTTGRVSIGCQNPSTSFAVGSTADCATSPASSMNAGDTGFTAASSRTFKEHLSPVTVDDILEKVAGVGVYSYDFIDGPKDKVGLMAEDFHRIFGRGSDKWLNGQEVDMALWLAVQELVHRSQQLEARNEALQQQIDDLKAQR